MRRHRPRLPSCPSPGLFGLLLLVLAGCPMVVRGSDEFDWDIDGKCHQECNKAMATQTNNDFNIRCNDSCKADKCQEGCDLWTEALSSNCPDLCNGSVNLIPDRALFCMMGCHIALNVYVKNIKDKVGVPAAPVLVAQSQTNVSVSLRWKGSSNPNITYLVQWKYESLPGDWEYYEPSSPLRVTECQVKKLHPYTKYKFRIAWIILPQHDPLTSTESVVISTLPYGVPSSAPSISLSAIDPTRILVSWDPPFFCNGPIVYYTVSLKDMSNGHILVKEIPNKNSDCFYLFNNLKPDTSYSVSVLARNNVGEGPSKLGNCKTPGKVQVLKTDDSPYLILGARHQVIKLKNDFLEEPDIIYQSNNSSFLITGVSLHIPRKMVFFSDNSGSVYSVPLEGSRKVTRILESSIHSPHSPGILSVDWLNHKLYLVDETRIGRCDLDGSNYETVLVSLPSEPTNMKVDPYNGFLFWISRSNNKGYMYKIDLIDIRSKPLTIENAKEICSDDNLSAFVTDYSSLQLLLPNQTKNTIESISLDGLETIDIRQNTQQPKFHDIKSFVVHDGLLYWTNGKEVFKEEYLSKTNKYYHISFSLLSSQNPFVGLNILHPDSQPYPIPLNPVSHLEAVFDSTQCKISWRPPKLLRGIGLGAWQKWNYELRISDSNNQEVFNLINISTSSILVDNLQNNVTYIIKARAYSNGGKGPWSEEYKGRTLRKGGLEDYPFMLWSSKEGILKSNMLATVVETLIHRNEKSLQGTHVIDFSWHDDLLFLNTNATQILVYNMTSRHKPKRLYAINHAHSLAVDWYARKLYWSNPYQQVISRSNFDGNQQEPLPIPTVARELNVDSSSAFLYWTTMYSVECARLNGGERQVYFQAGFFAGKQVLGLTVDADNHKVYWMVRSQEGAQLYRGTMAGYTDGSLRDTVEEMRILQEDIIRGPLRYYSDRLFWLHDQREALITDINGFNIATLKGHGLSNLKTLTVIDPQLHQYPDGLTKESLNVRPSQVSNNLSVHGTWDNFTITWQRVTNVNYGTIFYEIKVDCDYFKNTMITEDNYIVFAHLHPLPPYTNITIALRAFTYWSSSRRVIKVIHSPMSTPSEPLHPRIFISHEKPTLTTDQKTIVAQVRWSPPEQPNGIIKGYHITCWTLNDTPTPPNCNWTLNNPQKLEHTVLGLSSDSTYHFQVTAFTDVGDGPKSRIIEAKTSEESPVPRLLLTKLDAVQLADLDTREEHLVAMDAMEPVDVTYLNQDGLVFWIDRKLGIMRSNLDGSNKTKLLSLKSRGTSITVDWVGRFLYWSEVDETSQTSNIWKIDLNYKSESQKIIESKGTIRTLRSNPFSSMLLWTLEDESKSGVLMSSDANGNSIRLFFKQYPHGSSIQKREAPKADNGCTCPKDVDVGKSMTIDVSNPHHSEIIWVDRKTDHIWASDITGCKCHIIVNSSLIHNNGLPPTSLTVDKTRVYWSNASLQSIFSIKKSPEFTKDSESLNENYINSEIVNGVNIINAIGSGLQPMPDVFCLVPSQYEEPPILTKSLPDSITILMAPVPSPSGCDEISQPSVYYIVYYRLNDSSSEDCKSNLTLCQTVKSYKPRVTIPNLLPYRHYAFQVAVGNFYAAHHPSLTPEIVFRTEAGAPSEPTDVSLKVLTPEKILVKWRPPEHLNGPSVRYYLNWEMIHKGSTYQTEIVKPYKENEDQYYAFLENLRPASTYHVKVLACKNNTFNCGESPRESFTTFPTPGNLTLDEVTSSSLVLKWQFVGDNNIIDDSLMCGEIYSNKQNVLSQQTIHNDTLHFYVLNNLLPKTKYVCHLSVAYCNLSQCIYVWPKGDRFTFETLGDRPGEPGIPYVNFLKKDTFQVTWHDSSDNGGEILYYILQAQSYQGDFNENAEWQNVYNGSQSKWLVSGLNLNFEYYFRVMAINEFGASNYSKVSAPFNFSDTAVNEEETSIILAISVSIITVLILITLCILFRVCKQKVKDKLILQEVVRATGNTDVELATLQDLPHSGNFRHQTNILYSIGNHLIDEDLAALPHISKDQIILTKFLGSGAFGEVFEGFARDLQEDLDGDMKVAIKTLRKGATDQEKAEFLKEAQLMSNFKHEHILSLLGVCLDNDPNFIILELMEGGDLLSYLRSNRPTALEPSPLTVPDLISICVDVAKGCKYLEEMHFVHRDLAARNCLVSSRNPALRVVKIGDFGLARDIYKNDYYRKEGEGLLPVRWMSPESLMDGVFTTQSDAWAFGVLLWEVMTLGLQPYPARNNLEVLHYVRAGGRLDKPNNCPDDLHQLMLLCWSYNPDHRPTFTYCLDQLQELKRKSADLPNCIHNNHYVGRTLTGVSPLNSMVKERGSVMSSNDIISNNGSLQRHRTSSIQDFLAKQGLSVDLKPQNGIIPVERSLNSSQDIPKYLELLCDDASFSSLASDGYEVPISSCGPDKKIDIASHPSSARLNGTLCVTNIGTSHGLVTDENKCQALNGKFLSSRPCSCPPHSEDDLVSSSNPFVTAPRFANFGSCEKCADDSGSHRSSFISTTPSSTTNPLEPLETHVPTVSWC